MLRLFLGFFFFLLCGGDNRTGKHCRGFLYFLLACLIVKSWKSSVLTAADRYQAERNYWADRRSGIPAERPVSRKASSTRNDEREDTRQKTQKKDERKVKATKAGSSRRAAALSRAGSASIRGNDAAGKDRKSSEFNPVENDEDWDKMMEEMK